MFISSPALAANVAPIPFLTPQWDWNPIAEGAQPAQAQDIFDILMEGEELNLRLNARGLAAQQRFRPEDCKLAQDLEALAPGVLNDLYDHHVAKSDDPSEPRVGTIVGQSAPQQQTGLSSKRRLWQQQASRKQPRISADVQVVIDMGVAEDKSAHASTDDPAKVLRQLLSDMVDDTESAADFWKDSMKQISQEVNKLKAMKLMDQVGHDEYRCALKVMESAINECVSNGRWDSTSAVPCLEVVSVAMEILSEKTIGGNLYSDNLLQYLVDFVDGYVSRVVLDNLEKAFKKQQEKDESSGKRRKLRTRDWHSEWKERSGRMSQLLILLADVVKQPNIVFQDSELLRISKVTLQLFFVDGAEAIHQMQQTSVVLLQALFAKYKNHRESIMEEIRVRASSWQPSQKEFSFGLAPQSGHIQMLTALIFQILQACADEPSDSKETIAGKGLHASDSTESLLMRFVREIEKKLQVRRSDSAVVSGYHLLYQHLVSDAAKVAGTPEWPVASLVLRVMRWHAYEMSKRELIPLAVDALGQVIVCMQKLHLHQQAMTIQNNLEHVQQLKEYQEDILRQQGSTSLVKAPLAMASAEIAESAVLPRLYAQQALLIYLMAAAKRGNDRSQEVECYRTQWNETVAPGHALPPKNEITTTHAAAFATLSTCFDSVDMSKLLNPLLLILKESPIPKYRQKALKSLSSAVELDPSILKQKDVCEIVNSRMLDTFRSVRAEAVLLVGKFMAKDRQVTEKYMESICKGCKDSGPSVRKASMQILHDIMAKGDQDKMVLNRACVSIIPLLKDDSVDIQSKVFGFLRDMWFPTRGQQAGDGEQQALSAAARFEQVIAIVDAAHSSSATVGRGATSIIDILEDFVREAVQSVPGNKEMCKQYCNEAVQAIIRTHENEAGGKCLFIDLLRLFRTLALFARVQPDLVSKNVEFIHLDPSLKPEQKSEELQVWYKLTGTMASIYVHVLPVMADHPQKLVDYLLEDLPKIMLETRSMDLLETSIECFCTLIRAVGESPSKAQDMHRKLQTQVKRFQHNTAPGFEHCARALIIVGLFCRFSNFSLTIKGMVTSAIPKDQVQDLYDKCHTFVRKETVASRLAGISCLGSLFVLDASLILRNESKKVLTGALCDQDERIVMRAVKALADFVAEDVTDADAATVRNSVMQLYLDKILACGYRAGDDVAIAALRLVSLVRERGQIHPQMCIADMVAIQQREGDCAAVGFQALKAISEKFSDYYTPQLFVDGVLKGHKLWQQQQQQQKDADPGQSRKAAPVKVDSFSRVFELRRPNKNFVQRTANYAVEQIGKGGEGDLTQRDERTSAMGFLATVVTALPFPDFECVRVLVQMAFDAGVKLGSHALSALNTLCDGEHTERAAAMDDAARAFILFEIRRFLLANYSHRSSFPLEVSTTLETETLLKALSVGECCEQLELALSEATERIDEDRAARDPGSAGSRPGRVRGRRSSAGAERRVSSDEDDSAEDGMEEDVDRE